jgi:hypothetical protein
VTAPRDALLTCLRILGQRAAARIGFGRHPGLAAALQFGRTDVQGDLATLRINRDLIARLDQASGPPSAASGDTCPTTKPWLPPEKRRR